MTLTEWEYPTTCNISTVYTNYINGISVKNMFFECFGPRTSETTTVSAYGKFCLDIAIPLPPINLYFMTVTDIILAVRFFSPFSLLTKKLRIGCFFLPFSINVCSFTMNNQRGFLLLNWTYTSRQISDDQFTHWVCKRSIFKTHLFQMARSLTSQTPANEQAANKYNTRGDHHSLPIKS